MDTHKIFLVVVVGGGGGAEGLRWDLPEVQSPIGCQDKFHHIVKKKRHWLCAHCVPMFNLATL